MKDYQDLLARNDITFVILSKDNRIQVIHKPSKSDLRRRGKKGWKLNTYCLDGNDGNLTRNAFSKTLEVMSAGWFGEEKPTPQPEAPNPPRRTRRKTVQTQPELES